MQFLGQHFLKNDPAIKKIIAALDIRPNEIIIEIGPGKGALTFPLAEECAQKKCKLIAIEKDTALVQDLGLKIKNNEYKNIEIISGDALKTLPDLIHNSKFIIPNSNYKIVGNIPYYITGKLLRTISELENKPSVSVLMVQKEVAERICAAPPQMNLLAAATQYWANPEIILRLKAKEFDPPPEVDSAVIKLETQNTKHKIHNKTDEEYYKLIHIIFKQPRKTLANNLKDGLNISRAETEKIFQPEAGQPSAENTLNLPLNCRPQDLTVENILELARKLKL